MSPLRRFLCCAACTALIGLSAPPARAEGPPVFLADDARGVGVGVILGEPTGFTLAWRAAGPSTIDAALAWSVPEERFHVHADYLFTVVSFRDPVTPAVKFPIYVGAGPRLHLGGSSSSSGASILGVRIPMGVAVQGTGVPVEGFLERAPVVGLYPSTRADFDAALGVRVYLGSRLQRVEPTEPVEDPWPEPAR